MYIFSGKFLDDIGARLTGPMNFRFIIQPAVAIFLGIRDGLMDAKAGTPPFIFDLIHNPQRRKRQLKSALKTLLKSIIVGIVIDAIVQYMLFKHIRPLPAVLVGAFVMGVPYSLSRGITNRIVSFRKKKKTAKQMKGEKS